MKQFKIYPFKTNIQIKTILEIFDDFKTNLIKDDANLKYFILTIELINPIVKKGNEYENISLILCENFKISLKRKTTQTEFISILNSNIRIIRKHNVFAGNNENIILFNDIKLSFKPINYSDFISKDYTYEINKLIIKKTKHNLRSV